MPNKSIDPRNVYELMENDEGETMLLLYAGETAPQDPTFYINENTHTLELYRNSKDTVIIEGLTPDSISKLKNKDKLYICEMKYNDTPNSENEILYAYITIPQKKTLPPEKIKEPSLSEKAKNAREKILKKA